MGVSHSTTDEYPLKTAPINTTTPVSFNFLKGLIIEGINRDFQCFNLRDHKPLYFCGSGIMYSNQLKWPMRITKVTTKFSKTNPNPSKWLYSKAKYLSYLCFKLEGCESMKQLREVMQCRTKTLLRVLPADVLDYIGLFMHPLHTAEISLGGSKVSYLKNSQTIYQRKSEVVVWFQNELHKGVE
jgi:hypothetical protein